MIARETAQALRLITAPFLVVDEKGEIVFVNPSFCELLKREKSLLIGRSGVELAAGSPEMTSQTLKLFFGSGDWLVGFLSLRTGDGSALDFPCKGCVMQRPSLGRSPLVAIQLDQHLQFQVFGHQIDGLNGEIRLRRQIEAQLRERSAKLEQEVAERKKAELHVAQLSMQNRLILDSVGESICGLDMDGRCTFVNPAALQFLGFRAEELIGHHSHLKFHHTRPDGRPYPEEECPVHASFKQGSVNRGRDRYWRKDGSSFPVEFISTPILDAGKMTGAVVTFRDITELTRTEEELRNHRQHLEKLVTLRTVDLTKANERLEATNKELEAFSYSISHDLRVPIRAIDGFSRILLEDYSAKLDVEGQRVLNVVRDSTVKMARLIDDILAFSAIGRSEMASARTDMDGLVRAVIAELEPVLAGRKLRFDIKPLASARGDPAMIRRVWSNLIDNAVKFTACKPDAVIEVGSTVGQDETTYYVKDNGAGFDMQYANKLFGAFQRLHGVEFAGAGIGLAIVKRIVARHGGRVWGDGKVNEGATFYFTLPIRENSHG